MVSIEDWPRLVDMPLLIGSLAPGVGFVFLVVSLYFATEFDHCIEGDFARRNAITEVVLTSISTVICLLLFGKL